jgi:hypothetical protein
MPLDSGFTTMGTARILAMLYAIASVAGCAVEDKGFSLPPGDAERGRAAFISFRCFDCHEVHQVDLPKSDKSDQVLVKLGGEVTREKSYVDLVTGVINPSHRLAAGYVASEISDDGKSRMTVYNDVMTVAQLIDIVTFLQEHYELRPYEPTSYPDYTLMP